jgi:hypothetical protein
VSPSLELGARVAHTSFGAGVVVAVRAAAPALATVVFDDGGQRTLRADMLERLATRPAGGYPIAATAAELLSKDVVEVWSRGIVDRGERDIGGVEALHRRGDWPWLVEVWAMSAVRDEPLEGELRAAIRAALKAVPDVTRVFENDRENWTLQGTPAGQALVAAVADVLDRYEGRIRVYFATTRRARTIR